MAGIFKHDLNPFDATKRSFYTSNRVFGLMPQGKGDRTKWERRLGGNDHPYYGVQAQQTLDQKHGTKQYVQQLQGQGYTLGRVNNRGRKRFSASSQLLGGGG